MSAQVMVKIGSVRRMGAALGAEVIGLDLVECCDQMTLDWIRDALQEHHVLGIREQVAESDLKFFGRVASNQNQTIYKHCHYQPAALIILNNHFVLMPLRGTFEKIETYKYALRSLLFR